MDFLIYTVDVDVCIRRPPIPSNCVTSRVILQVDANQSPAKADAQAQCIAAQVAGSRGEMPVRTRIVSLQC